MDKVGSFFLRIILKFGEKCTKNIYICLKKKLEIMTIIKEINIRFQLNILKISKSDLVVSYVLYKTV